MKQCTSNEVLSVCLILYFKVKSGGKVPCASPRNTTKTHFSITPLQRSIPTPIWYEMETPFIPRLRQTGLFIDTQRCTCHLIYNDKIAYSAPINKHFISETFCDRFTVELTALLFLFYNEIYCARSNHNFIGYQGRYDFHTS